MAYILVCCGWYVDLGKAGLVKPDSHAYTLARTGIESRSNLQYYCVSRPKNCGV